MGLKEIQAELKDVLDMLSNTTKTAYNLFSVGDRVVAVDKVQGITQGTIYIVSDNNPKPGYIVVQDMSGKQIGMFRGDRFVKDNKEY